MTPPTSYTTPPSDSLSGTPRPLFTSTPHSTTRISRELPNTIAEEPEEEDDFDSSSVDIGAHPVQSQAFIAMRLNSMDKTVDRVFGPKPSNDGTWRIGNEEIEFLPNGDIKLGRQEYPGTQALYHFLFKKNMPAYHTDEDADAYASILLTSGVHRKGFSIQQPERFTNTYKYKNVISPLLRRGADRSRRGIFDRSRNGSRNNGNTVGEGYKLVTEQTKDFVYYEDPNELVDRLRLLVAAEQAGNNLIHHHNEIESILQELRDHGIITG